MKKDFKKIKVVTVVGTRPEIIRLSEVIKALDQNFEHILVHTGQNYDYELNEIFFKDLSLKKPNYFLNSVGSNSMETVGNIIAKTSEVLIKEKPDAFLVLGDTNSCLAAYSAKRRKIPVFHMEAGNRCFDERVPEEINRRIIDHISDINIVYSDQSRMNLIREGLKSDRIIKSGSPMFEVLKTNEVNINSSDVLSRLKLKDSNYFVFSAHREENIENPTNFRNMVDILNILSKKYKMPIIFSCHPRTKAKIDQKKIKLPSQVKIMKPLGFFDYVSLQKRAFCVISDSGTISEESSILGFPAINIREAHERPEAMDEAAVIMTGLNVERIIQAIEILQSEGNSKNVFRSPDGYDSGNVSQKVVRIIASYIDYVNQNVWKKRS